MGTPSTPSASGMVLASGRSMVVSLSLPPGGRYNLQRGEEPERDLHAEYPPVCSRHKRKTRRDAKYVAAGANGCRSGSTPLKHQKFQKVSSSSGVKSQIALCGGTLLAEELGQAIVLPRQAGIDIELVFKLQNRLAERRHVITGEVDAEAGIDHVDQRGQGIRECPAPGRR